MDKNVKEEGFDTFRDRLWTEALTLYYMGIPPCLPGELEEERKKAMITATGAEQLEPIIIEAFIDAHKRAEKRYVLSSELAELCDMPANQVGILATKIHRSMGGKGSKSIYKENNKKGYKCDDISLPARTKTNSR